MLEDAVIHYVQHVNGVVVAFDDFGRVVMRFVFARTAIGMSALSNVG